MLGLSEDILADFQLICGTCSPLPIFDVCGLGNNFPGVEAQCNVEHCAALMVPWYETNYANCLDDLRGFGASDAQLATMIGFYDKCAAIDVEAQEELCEPIFLGDDIGFQNIMEYHDDDGSCTLSIAELATVCAAFYAECLSFLASSEEAVDVPEDCEPVFLGPDIGFANIMEYHDEDGTCEISMSELAAVCTDFFAECIAFLDSEDQSNEGEETNPDDVGPVFAGDGWALLTADRTILNIGDETAVLFSSLLREDFAVALGIHIDYVSIKSIT
jgi:hypothetical protein